MRELFSVTSDLRELYQEVILDHSKKPRNFGALPDATRQADGYNPLCGDRATVFVRLDGDVVADVKFQGAGCSISTASASMMTEAVKGKSRDGGGGAVRALPRPGDARRGGGRSRRSTPRSASWPCSPGCGSSRCA